jgi:hypothetical protein
MEDSTLALGLFVVGIVLALLAIFVVGLNYSILYINHRNRKRGNDRHISMIFLVPQILLILARMLFQHFPVYPVSGWLLLCIALLDPGIWSVAKLSFELRSKK